MIGQTYHFPDGVEVTIQVVAPRELHSDEIFSIVVPLFTKVEELQVQVEVHGYVQ